MKANEFRIGNLIEFRFMDKKTVRPITYKDFETIVDLSNGFGVGGRDIPSPIPLDETWLKRLGFTEMFTKRGMYLKPLGKELTIDGEDFLFNLENGYAYQDNEITVDPIGVPIKYVHTFQNVFYFLTGQELTLT